jgi:hypothetical protein
MNAAKKKKKWILAKASLMVLFIMEAALLCGQASA